MGPRWRGGRRRRPLAVLRALSLRLHAHRAGTRVRSGGCHSAAGRRWRGGCKKRHHALMGPLSLRLYAHRAGTHVRSGGCHSAAGCRWLGGRKKRPRALMGALSLSPSLRSSCWDACPIWRLPFCCGSPLARRTQEAASLSDGAASPRLYAHRAGTRVRSGGCHSAAGRRWRG